MNDLFESLGEMRQRVGQRSEAADERVLDPLPGARHLRGELLPRLRHVRRDIERRPIPVVRADDLLQLAARVVEPLKVLRRDELIEPASADDLCIKLRVRRVRDLLQMPEERDGGMGRVARHLLLT